MQGGVISSTGDVMSGGRQHNKIATAGRSYTRSKAMATYWLTVVLACAGLWSAMPAQAQRVPLLVNNSSDTYDGRGDVDLDVIELLLQLSPATLQLIPTRLGDARAWRLLQQDASYCAVSKIYKPERASFLYYSQRPSSVYPPFQWLSYWPKQSQPIDLSKVLQEQPGLKIGIVAGRSYGEQIDKLIAAYPLNFFQRSGEGAAETLLTMLGKQRLDAIIEFAAMARSHLRVAPARPFVVQSIADQPVIAGFLVCHKSPQGLAVIKQFDALMQLPAYRSAVYRLHQRYFSADDFALIEPALLKWFPAVVPEQP